METIIKNENGYPREDYYYGIMQDVRNVFIGYGRYLERNDIPKEGSIEDYETFLQFQDAKMKEFDVDDCFKKLPQKTKEYMEFVDFLMEQQGWEHDLIIIKGEHWDEFYSTNDEDYEMKIDGWVQADKFYDKFAEIINTDKWKFESAFVSSKYIDTYTYNTINLIVNINGKNERFIIDCV